MIRRIGALGAFTTILVLAGFSLPAAFPAHSQVPSGGAHGPSAASLSTAPPTFYSEMAKVNARMHEAMDIAPSGDVDRDFIRMMIPHHQGAIDMARVLLKYGTDAKLKRLAQSIIVEQSQEIAYMRMLDDERDKPRQSVR
jgi:Domain of unknown function (DUF305)